MNSINDIIILQVMNSINDIIIKCISNTNSTWIQEIKVDKRWVNKRYKSIIAQARCENDDDNDDDGDDTNNNNISIIIMIIIKIIKITWRTLVLKERGSSNNHYNCMVTFVKQHICIKGFQLQYKIFGVFCSGVLLVLL